MLLSSILYELLGQIYRGKTSEMSQAWKSCVPQSMSQLILNQGKTGALMVDQNGGKFERI